MFYIFSQQEREQQQQQQQHQQHQQQQQQPTINCIATRVKARKRKCTTQAVKF